MSGAEGNVVVPLRRRDLPSPKLPVLSRPLPTARRSAALRRPGPTGGGGASERALRASLAGILLLAGLSAPCFGQAASSGQEASSGQVVPLFEPKPEAAPAAGAAEDAAENAAENGDGRARRSEVPGSVRGRTASDPHGLDLRSVERLRWGCRNEFGRRELTLFADGTVRLREGLLDAQTVDLDILLPSDLNDYLRRLARIRLSPEFPEAWDLPAGVVGSWSETCDLSLRLPGLDRVDLRFGNYDALPLELGQIEQIADELAANMAPREGPRRLPPGYAPQPFDVLEATDGKLYRVVGLTDDGQGLEVESLSEPVRTFYRLEDLRILFVALRPADAQPPPFDEGVELEVVDPPS